MRRTLSVAFGDDLDELAVQPHVTRDLRMERRGDDVALTYRDDPTGGRPRTHGGEHLDAWPGLLDPRRTDEHRMERPARDALDLEIGLEGVDLPAEGVAAHRDVERTERALPLGGVEQPAGEQDHPRARAVRGQPALDRGPQRLEQLEGVEQLDDRGRLPARQDDPVDPRKVLRVTHPHRAGPRLLERSEVLAHVALHREDADPGCGSNETPCYARTMH